MNRNVRKVCIRGDLAYIPLTQGYEAIIDASDVALVDGFNWFPMVKGNTIYSYRNKRKNGKKTTMLMHRVIMGATCNLHVDHIDGNGLNNSKSNLRFATASQNHWNSRISRANTSGFKGVHWSKAHSKWIAKIKVNGRQKHLGVFETPEDAHAAYAKASKALHGDFGRIY